MKNFSLIIILIFIPFVVKAQFPQPDITFSNSGSLTIPDFRPIQIVALNDGGLLYVGRSASGILIKKTNSSGVINEQFGNAGSVFLPYVYLKLYVQPDNKLLLAGTNGDESLFTNIYSVITLIRLHEDGSVDTGFGDEGIVHLNNAIPSMHYQTLRGTNAHGDLLFINNKIFVVGSSTIPYPFEDDYMDEISIISIFQLLMDGTLDNAFGEGGTK